jgi:hypothetical protein
MHRRHPYGPHLTAALHPPCKSLDNQAHRLAPLSRGRHKHRRCEGAEPVVQSQRLRRSREGPRGVGRGARLAPPKSLATQPPTGLAEVRGRNKQNMILDLVRESPLALRSNFCQCRLTITSLGPTAGFSTTRQVSSVEHLSVSFGRCTVQCRPPWPPFAASCTRLSRESRNR